MRSCPNCQRTYSDDIGFCPQDGTPLPPTIAEAVSELAEGLARRYRIVRRLGAGGMGTVFLAEQIAVGNRLVALKVLLRKLLDDPEFLMRFTNEAASTGRIHHPNVVTVYESGQADDGSPYLAMEYLEGETLRQALKSRGAMSISEATEILQQVARGLNAAHKLGTIHRDLKPDNIFLTRDDEGQLVVKVVDFGIAKLRESASHTLTGTVLGTPAYMSFEQPSGMKSEELDARSDVYSLGVVVYEMLMGCVPFDSETPMGYVRKHLMEESPPFRTVQPYLPMSPELEQVVLKALTKERDYRYSSALEFARAFTEAAKVKSAPTPTPKMGSTVVTPRPMEGFLRKPAPEKHEDSTSPVPPSVAPEDSSEADLGAPAPPKRGIPEPPKAARPSRPARQTPERARPPAVQPARVEERIKPPQQASRPVSPAPTPVPASSQTVPIALAIVLALILIAGSVWYFTRSTTQTQLQPPPEDHSSSNPQVKTPAGMVEIAGGTFMMGLYKATDAEETPAHSVTVGSFYLDKTPVTNAAYAEFVRATHHDSPPGWEGGTYPAGQDNFPVVRVSWDDAQTYCQWKGMRLPTEVEWEFAARGTDERTYSWGDTFDAAYVNSKEAGLSRLEPVGSHRGAASPAGVYDLSGNVWQWCQDDYQPYRGHQSPFQCQGDPRRVVQVR